MAAKQTTERFCIHRFPRQSESTPKALVLSASPSTCPSCAREEVRFRIASVEARYDHIILESTQKRWELDREYAELYASVKSGAHSECLKQIIIRLGNLEAERSLNQVRKADATRKEVK